ncbi:iron ABC transporter permease [Alkalibaculum bacchi]|uniref:ABC transporter permease n=1 Tax=Alkalibaculum bacchi TaxID=645887 RepID=UPI0026F1275E|nr:ABC transporter permease subunit [Alkalibaculum bacchi]
MEVKRYKKTSKKLLSFLNWIPFAILMIPLLGLIYSSIIEDGKTIDIFSLVLPTGRRFSLLIRSILLSLSVSLTSLFIALSSALKLYSVSPKNKRVTDTIWRISILMLLLPSFIHSQSWWKTFGILSLPTSGLLPAWWVSVMYFLPLPFTLISLSLKAIDKDALEAGAVFFSPGVALLRVVLPSVLPAILGGALLVFLLSLADYSIPSIFSLNVYSLDIFAQFSVSGSVADSFFYSLPLLMIASVVVIVGLNLLQDLSLTTKGETIRNHVTIVLPPSVSLLSGMGLVISLLCILIPSSNLILGMFQSVNTVETIEMGLSELINSLIISSGSLLISLPLSLSIGMQMSNKKLSGLAYFVLILPLIMPASLIGIGLIGVFHSTYWYNSIVMPILAIAIRYTPVGALLCYSGFKGLDKEMINASLVYQKSTLNGFLKILFPVLFPIILMAALSIFIIGTGEIGATIMVLPPGFNTLSIKIYNYLHYGSSQVVSVLCFMLVSAIIIVVGIAQLGTFYTQKGRDKNDS